MQKDPKLIDEFYQFLFKIMIPAVAGIAAKVAIQMKNEKLSIGRIIISFIAGIVCAYFAYPLAEYYIKGRALSPVIGIIAISGEKITEYLVYKLEVQAFLSAVFNSVYEKFTGKK